MTVPASPCSLADQQGRWDRLDFFKEITFPDHRC